MDLLGREAKGVGYPNPKDTPNSILYLQEKQHRRRAVAYFWINGQTVTWNYNKIHQRWCLLKVKPLNSTSLLTAAFGATSLNCSCLASSCLPCRCKLNSSQTSAPRMLASAHTPPTQPEKFITKLQTCATFILLGGKSLPEPIERIKATFMQKENTRVLGKNKTLFEMWK